MSEDMGRPVVTGDQQRNTTPISYGPIGSEDNVWELVRLASAQCLGDPQRNELSEIADACGLSLHELLSIMAQATSAFGTIVMPILPSVAMHSINRDSSVVDERTATRIFADSDGWADASTIAQLTARNAALFAELVVLGNVLDIVDADNDDDSHWPGKPKGEPEEKPNGGK